jgi:hypothetical protein
MSSPITFIKPAYEIFKSTYESTPPAQLRNGIYASAAALITCLALKTLKNNIAGFATASRSDATPRGHQDRETAHKILTVANRKVNFWLVVTVACTIASTVFTVKAINK